MKVELPEVPDFHRGQYYLRSSLDNLPNYLIHKLSQLLNELNFSRLENKFWVLTNHSIINNIQLISLFDTVFEKLISDSSRYFRDIGPHNSKEIISSHVNKLLLQNIVEPNMQSLLTISKIDLFQYIVSTLKSENMVVMRPVNYDKFCAFIRLSSIDICQLPAKQFAGVLNSKMLKSIEMELYDFEFDLMLISWNGPTLKLIRSQYPRINNLVIFLSGSPTYYFQSFLKNQLANSIEIYTWNQSDKNHRMPKLTNQTIQINNLNFASIYFNTKKRENIRNRILDSIISKFKFFERSN